MLRFFIFRNVWIALCAVAMALETDYLTGFSITPDAFTCFLFFATFFVYNFHAFANHLVTESARDFFHLLDRRVSLSQRASVIIGFVGCVITFLFISNAVRLMCLALGII